MVRGILLRASLALALLGAASGVVSAGSKSYIPLTINATSRYANGGLAETHNTADTVQYAECGTNPTTGYCTFRDVGGTYYSCYTTDPSLLTVIRSMSDESSFSVTWNDVGQCTYVLSYASSRTAAKAH